MNQVYLTPQEVAALLQGLSQGETNCSAPTEPAPGPGRLPAGRGERRGGLGLQKISHWWAAIMELQWPQF